MDEESSTKEEKKGSFLKISSSPSFFVVAYNALLTCLGLRTVDPQSKSQESSSTSTSVKENDEKASEESPQDPPPTSTTDPLADPPTDNSEDPPTDAVLNALVGRTPPVSSGGGGQINSTSS